MSSFLHQLRLQSQDALSILTQPSSNPRHIASGRPQQKTPLSNNSSAATEVILPHPCMGTVVLLLLRASSFPRVNCLPSRCLATNIYPGFAILGFQASCHNIKRQASIATRIRIKFYWNAKPYSLVDRFLWRNGRCQTRKAPTLSPPASLLATDILCRDVV
jgi:hypothetical protein